MEMEKVIRLISLFILCAALAVRIATKLMFPDASNGFDLPVVIILVISLAAIWRPERKDEKRNE